MLNKKHIKTVFLSIIIVVFSLPSAFTLIQYNDLGGSNMLSDLEMSRVPTGFHYPGTFDFDDSDPNTVPNGWTDGSTGNAFVKVVEKPDSHQTVLQLWDGDPNGLAYTYTSFSDQKSGTVEFWWRAVYDTESHAVILMDRANSACLALVIMGLRLYVINPITKSWQDTTAILIQGVWNHVRIDFNAIAWSFYLNNVPYGVYFYYGPNSDLIFLNNGLDYIGFFTYTPYYGIFEVDAIGITGLADNYHPGDNLIPIGCGDGVVRKWAVICGVSDYKAISDLPFSHLDAGEWHTFLKYSPLTFNTIYMYGDDRRIDDPRYNGIAKESNVKNALQNVVNLADEDDYIAFINIGHGGGNGLGSSYLCMWDCASGEDGQDGYFYDTELASILDDAVTDKIFVFLDSCYSGGFGPELMAIPNSRNVLCTTTCTDHGYGYQSYALESSLWTYYFMEHAWYTIYESSPSISLEQIYDTAHDVYPFQEGPDEPQLFDGSSFPFYLT
ncbi:MAG: hypothetical protein ACFFBP_01880 [Promethearchaeota archaeon]